jgi:copper chaperone
MEETLLNVKGMSCPSCVRHINQALGEVDGVEQVDVKLREGQVLVKHGPSVAQESLVEAIAEAGFTAQPTR